MDKGKISEDCHIHPETTLLPSCWETRGFSYELNAGTPNGLPLPSTLKIPAGSIFGKDDGWIPEPSKFILFYEPPAAVQVCHKGLFKPRWYQWHQARSTSDFLDPKLAPAQFLSMVLFADGHAKIHDFVGTLRTDPYYPYEETKQWIWYKPGSTNNVSGSE
jgi:prepilin-type processing-associated H-X9-DG protein